MKKLLGGLGIGVALMYLLDPEGGGRRRALGRDKLVRFWTRGKRQAGGLSEDLRNRARGVVAETRSKFRCEQTADDQVLEARVRSELGHVVSNPRSIEVTVSEARVALRGPILASEVDSLLERVFAVPGVTDVENLLEPV